MKAFILAAGLGTRLSPLDSNLPKPLVSIKGKPLILWNIEKLRDSGINDIVINLFYKGEQIREFCYIDDFIKAFDLLLQKGKHLNIYNIGTSEKIKIKDLALKISKISKRKILIQKTPLTRGSTKIRVPNISKIKKIGFRPKFNLDKGLRKSIV